MWETEASPKASGSLLRQIRTSSSNRHVVDADNRGGYTQGKEAYPWESNRVSHRADQLHRTKSSRSKAGDLNACQVCTKGSCMSFGYLHVSDRGASSALKTNEANDTNSVQ